MENRSEETGSFSFAFFCKTKPTILSWLKDDSNAAKLLGLPKVKTESVYGKIIPSLIGIIGIILLTLI